MGQLRLVEPNDSSFMLTLPCSCPFRERARLGLGLRKSNIAFVALEMDVLWIHDNHLLLFQAQSPSTRCR